MTDEVDKETVSVKCFGRSKRSPYAHVYEYSKLFFLLFSYELRCQLGVFCHVCVYKLSFHFIFWEESAVDPGVVKTNIMREVPPCLSSLAFIVLRLLCLLQSPEVGGSSILDAALASPDEEADWVARHNRILVNNQNEVLLCKWKQNCNFHGKRKFVSFGGWIEIEGLPFNLWSKETFKQIGDACGGYLETDYRTENFLILFAARIKVKANESGLIPEFVDVIGNFEVFYVRINPVVWSNCLSVPRGRLHWKSARTEKLKARELPRWSQSLNFQNNGAANSPAKLPEGEAGKTLVSDPNSLEQTRHLEAWRENVLGVKKGESGDSGVLKTGNVWGAENGSAAWEKEDRITQVGILKETIAAKAKNLESGYERREKKKTELRFLNEGGPAITSWACRDFTTAKGQAWHKDEQSDLGPTSSVEEDRRKITRRHSDGGLIINRRFVETEGSAELTPRFLSKFGQGSKNNLRVLAPNDFEGRKMHALCAAKTKPVEKKAVLLNEDEVLQGKCVEGKNQFEEWEPANSVVCLKRIDTEIIVERNSIEEELEKEERDWSLNPETGEAVTDRNEEGIVSIQDLDPLLCSEEETEPSVDEFSSKGDIDEDPLEDAEFSLGKFMANSSFCKGQ
ncbi:hypothetical protein M0R45_026939 [Rubus argutus]|uniref:DUF4283 domain-containing protein n=1 Tax=Rubus argutus TaxID=59490 RepID=A0AAW1WZ34_RUBAR